MTDRTGPKPPSGDYAVGYGEPPQRTRFRKGQSGNPGGRPRGMTAGRARALALKEAYRMVSVREGDSVVCVPALQAILRSLVMLAAKGNCSAQRLLIEMVQETEDLEVQAARDTKDTKQPQMTERELARRIAWILSGGVPKGNPQGRETGPPTAKNWEG